MEIEITPIFSVQIKKMSEGGFDAEFVLSLVATVAGGALSAYLAKKMIDALDTGKKV